MLDLINAGKLDPQQALDVMVSYAIAEEGTNTLYLGLIDLIARRDYLTSPYTLTEIEMILNYFPHEVWQDVNQVDLPTDLAQAKDMSPVRQKFYYPMIRTLDLHWKDLTHDQFLAMVQGLTLTGPDVFGTETANNML